MGGFHSLNRKPELFSSKQKHPEPPEELLKMLRHRAGLTQASLAKEIGLKSAKMVQNWETRSNFPSVESLKKIIEFYLRRRVFLSSQEFFETEQLWESVKNFFDASQERNDKSYPAFDSGWFEQLLNEIKADSSTNPTKKEFSSKEDRPTTDAKEPEKVLILAERLPIRTIPPNNLPHSPNRLIGRETLVSQVTEFLQKSEDSRLVTLHGPGGTGKTRLALQVAYQLLDNSSFPDGVYWVGLAAVHQPQLLAVSIAEALELKIQAEITVEQNVVQFLEHRNILLILDNFEQIASAGSFLSELLEKSPRLKCLVTSRLILHQYEEQRVKVPPLELPTSNSAPTAEKLAENPSVQLFVERAKKVQPDFKLTDENAAIIAELCVKLDGLPLAIELVTSQLNLFTPYSLLARISASTGTRLKLLNNVSINKVNPHATLRAVLDWSYSLLEKTSQQIFRQLAVFPAGATLEALQEVFQNLISQDEGSDIETLVFENVSKLIDHSLLQTFETKTPTGSGTEKRFMMLETTRDYALGRLRDEEEEEAARRQHCLYYLGLVESAQTELRGDHQAEWMKRLEYENANLRAALDWAISGSGNSADKAELGLRLVIALPIFWDFRGYVSEGSSWVLAALKSGQGALAFRAKATNIAAIFANKIGDREQGERLLKEGLAIFRSIGDQRNIALALNNLGTIAIAKDNFQEAQEFLEECITIKRELGDLNSLAITLNNLGEVEMGLGNFEQAKQAWHKSLEIARKLKNDHSTATILLNLGILSEQLGEVAEAKDYLKESLSLFRNLTERFHSTECIEHLAGLIGLVPENTTAATQILAATQTFRQKVGIARTNQHQKYFDQLKSRLLVNLGENKLKTNWIEGEKRELEEISEFLLEKFLDC